MAGQGLQVGDKVVIEPQDFQPVLDALERKNYRVIGPKIKNGAIIYSDLKSVDELPAGWTDEQSEGHYRLKRREDAALFGYNLGPHSWKGVLHPSIIQMWKLKLDGNGYELTETPQPPQKFAFIGVRPCELHAIAIQDKVLLEGPYVDPIYKARREGCFILAVNCSQAGGNCFCVSMQTGPKANAGFDLALTEVLAGPEAYFLLEIGSEIGAAVMGEVNYRQATPAEIEKAAQVVEATARQMPQAVDTAGLKELLYRNYENPHWEEVANRCLACGNCTLSCPTCFCVTLEETSDLSGEVAGRVRKWDSCFNLDFSFIHGGSVRISPKSRYRQWLTHKFATWVDQFGSFGCVGCGRCITWCPVGINLVKEVQALRDSEGAPAPA